MSQLRVEPVSDVAAIAAPRSLSVFVSYAHRDLVRAEGLAALIEGLGELMSAHPSRWQRWAGPLFSGGLAASAGLGGALALDIIKRRRRQPRN